MVDKLPKTEVTRNDAYKWAIKALNKEAGLHVRGSNLYIKHRDPDHRKAYVSYARLAKAIQILEDEQRNYGFHQTTLEI